MASAKLIPARFLSLTAHFVLNVMLFWSRVSVLWIWCVTRTVMYGIYIGARVTAGLEFFLHLGVCVDYDTVLYRLSP